MATAMNFRGDLFDDGEDDGFPCRNACCEYDSRVAYPGDNCDGCQAEIDAENAADLTATTESPVLSDADLLALYDRVAEPSRPVVRAADFSDSWDDGEETVMEVSR